VTHKKLNCQIGLSTRLEHGSTYASALSTLNKCKLKIGVLLTLNSA
jgi:hypothetical protein